jgi:hypothetical protein
MRRMGSGLGLVVCGLLAGCGQSAGGSPAASGGSGGAASGGAGATSAGAGGSVAHECKLLNLKPGDVGVHGIRLLHDAGVTGEGDGLGFSAGFFYYRAGDVFGDSHLYKTSVDTGGEMDLGVIGVNFALLSGDSLIEFKGDNGPGDFTITPLANLGQPKTIVSGAPNPRTMVADATTLYFAAQDSGGLYSVPLSGGTPTLLVPNVLTEGLVLQGTTLYWLDFNSEHLMRVASTGGSPESLVEIFFGGPMVGDAAGVYWVDTSDYTVNEWRLGASTVLQLDKSHDNFVQPAHLAVDGNDVYWVSSFGCGVLTRDAKDGSKSEFVVDGFNDPNYIGITSSHLYVTDRGRAFVIDR